MNPFIVDLTPNHHSEILRDWENWVNRSFEHPHMAGMTDFGIHGRLFIREHVHSRAVPIPGDG